VLCARINSVRLSLEQKLCAINYKFESENSKLTREAIIQNTINALKALPENEAKQVSDFADFMLKKYEEITLQHGIQYLQSESESFSFLNEDEELYSTADIKEKF
jgi:hypothetical protein